jgi:hypothetical protein
MEPSLIEIRYVSATFVGAAEHGLRVHWATSISSLWGGKCARVNKLFGFHSGRVATGDRAPRGTEKLISRRPIPAWQR